MAGTFNSRSRGLGFADIDPVFEAFRAVMRFGFDHVNAKARPGERHAESFLIRRRPKVDATSCRADRSAPGCHEWRSNYLGNGMLVHSFLKYWVPVVAWILLIFVMSGDLMSAQHTSRFFVPFLRWIAPDISAETIALMQFLLRKAAHLAEYAILAVLVCRAFFRGTNLQWTRPALFASAWIACLLVATGDEFHQAHIASRTGSPWDVLIDCGGAMLGLLICSRWILRKPAV